MEQKILITGATGATGSSAIKRLLELNLPVRAMVHTIDERSDALAGKGVEIVRGDLSDFDSVSNAMKGITGAYFVYSTQIPGILQATSYFAQAAIEENVQMVVNISQRTARRETKSHAAQNHWIAERVFDWSGIPVAHLRPTLFAEWALYFAGEIKKNNRLISPFGNASYAPIASEDIGNVIASILADPAKHVGKTYPLYGPAELTQQEVADIFSEVLGRKITYVPMEISDFAGVLKGAKFDPYFTQHISAIAQDFRDGILKGNNNLVKEISGHAPLGMKEFIQKNIEVFE